jgi:hypothetical protein
MIFSNLSLSAVYEKELLIKPIKEVHRTQKVEFVS